MGPNQTKLLLNSLIILLLFECTPGQVNDFPSLPIVSYCTYYVSGICVHEPDLNEHSDCEYYINGVCIVRDNRFIEIDIEMLVWTFFITEVHTNIFYPGLGLFDLAAEENFELHFHWADINTQYSGTYGESPKPVADIYLRHNGSITKRMECMDKYFITSHELMHFIISKHLGIRNLNDDGHLIPNIFNQWEQINSIEENRPYNQFNHVEGLAYASISNECGYDE